jgi:hypothetical protein
MDKSLLQKNINVNPALDIDVIEYVDPTEYYNIAIPNEVSGVGTNSINARYWENNDTVDNDITTDELLEFYNKLT